MIQSMSLTNETLSIHVDHSMVFMLKMCFVYSAVMDGWKVEKLANNKICFSKKNVKKHFSLDSFMKKHVPTDLILYDNS